MSEADSIVGDSAVAVGLEGVDPAVVVAANPDPLGLGKKEMV